MFFRLRNVLFSAVLLTACGGDSTVDVDPPISIAFNAIACPETAYTSDFSDPVQQVIRSNHEFRDAYLANQPYPHDELPIINFDERMVLFVHSGSRPSGGYGTTIERIEQSDDTIVVHYTETEPGAGCEFPDVMTYPYCFVDAEAADVDVRFEKTTEKRCGADSSNP